MTPEQVLDRRWKPTAGARHRIAFVTQKIISAHVHWTRKRGLFVCPDPRNCTCTADSRPYFKSVAPILVFTNWHPVLRWWEFGQRNYQQLREHVQRYPLLQHEIFIDVEDERYARYSFSHAGEASWHGTGHSWKRDAENLLKHLPLWDGYKRPSEEDAPPIRWDRIGLLLNT